MKHLGNGVLLRPADDVWQSMEAGLAALKPGFELQRHQPDQQVRPAITRICRQNGELRTELKSKSRTIGARDTQIQ